MDSPTDSTGLNASSTPMDFGSLQMTPTQFQATQDDIQSNRAADSDVAQKQLDNSGQTFNAPAPKQDSNILGGLMPLLAISAFGGKATKLNASAMLGATQGIVDGYLSGKQDVYEDSVKKYQQAYKEFKDRQEQQDKIYQQMREAYKGRIDGDIKAMQFALAVTNDQTKNVANMQKQMDAMKTASAKLQEQYDKLEQDGHFKQQAADLAERKQKEKEKTQASASPGGDAILAAAADEGVSLFPAGMRSKDMQNRTLAAIAEAHPDMTPQQIVQSIRSGQIDMKSTMQETGVAAKKEAAIASAVNALNSPGGIYDQIDAAAKKIDFGDSKTVNQLRLAAQGEAVADPDIQAYVTTLAEAKAEVVQVLSRTGQPTDAVRHEADAMFPPASSYEELKASIAASKKIAAAVAAGNEQVIAALKAGTPIMTIANGGAPAGANAPADPAAIDALVKKYAGP